MKFFCNIYKPPFYLAIEKGDIDMVKLFLANEKLDVNRPYIYILIIILFIKFKYQIILGLSIIIEAI